MSPHFMGFCSCCSFFTAMIIIISTVTAASKDTVSIGLNEHAVYHDATGVYVVRDRDAIQVKAAQGILPNKIAANSEMFAFADRTFLSRRSSTSSSSSSSSDSLSSTATATATATTTIITDTDTDTPDNGNDNDADADAEADAGTTPDHNQNDGGRRRLATTVSENQDLLDLHNLYRSDTALGLTGEQPPAQNMNALFWDPFLAKVAQDYSALCVWEHNGDRIAGLNAFVGQTDYAFDSLSLSVGENIFYSSFGSSSDQDVVNNASARIALLEYGVAQYYLEHAYYEFETDSDGCCESGEQCGHYTQVVASNTRYVGCGHTVCDSGMRASANSVAGSETERTVLFSVCNYFPAGNLAGAQPYIPGCAGAQCDADRRCDSTGLCAGCQALQYTFCQDVYSNCDDLLSSCPTAGCDTSSTNDYCTGCRGVCGTCDASMFVAESTCHDNTMSTVAGASNGRTVANSFVESQFTASANCDWTESGTCTDAAVSTTRISGWRWMALVLVLNGVVVWCVI